MVIVYSSSKSNSNAALFFQLKYTIHIYSYNILVSLKMPEVCDQVKQEIKIIIMKSGFEILNEK